MSNKKFHIHFDLFTEEEKEQALIEAGYILTGLSEAINKYDKAVGCGSGTAKQKQYWKGLADEWKAKHKIILP